MDNSNSESKSDLTDLFGEIIYQYSRAQALEDGNLVDVSTVAKEAGYRYHFAVTRALWNAIETIPSHTSWQDVQGRLWDCLWMGRDAIRLSPAGVSRVTYQVILSTEGSRRKYQTLVLDLGPGDDAEPVFTMGFPEDF
jgi:hypothetical protein